MKGEEVHPYLTREAANSHQSQRTHEMMVDERNEYSFEIVQISAHDHSYFVQIVRCEIKEKM